MASATKRHIVAKTEELEPGHRKIIRLGNREIGVFNIDGDLYGLRNICPHRTGPLCLGRLRPLVVPMEFGYGHERENEILKCPWHQWEFDIKTGISITDPDIRVRSYRVEREGDNIVLYE
ncbi:MAG: 2Fe-2S ferredoxin [Gemmatimonadetes bacterium]|nr:2Fe-2S ferredoxin [Gemmatimonadota bacterium]|tara:strand:+ start:653 stop:1012 length:360 start_codon:yes stop_codon:yes gene_type:complete